MRIDLPGALRGSEPGAVEGDRAVQHVGQPQDRPVEREDLRRGRRWGAVHRVDLGRARGHGHDAHLGRCGVGHRVKPGPGLEVRRDGAEPGVVVAVDVTGLAGVVADEPVHPGTRPGRERAVVRRRRGLQGFVVAVEVGGDGVDEPAAPVVDAHRDVRQRLGLAVLDGPLVVGQAEVVDGQAVEVGRQRHVGEEGEVRCGRLSTSDGHELLVAQRLRLALERAAAAVDERLVRDVHGVVRARAGRHDARAARRRCPGIRLRLRRVRRVARQLGRRREVLLRQVSVAVEDVDVFFLRHLVHRLAADRVLRDVDRHEVVVGDQGLVVVVVVGQVRVERQILARRRVVLVTRRVQVELRGAEAVVAVHGLAEVARGGVARLHLDPAHRGLHTGRRILPRDPDRLLPGQDVPVVQPGRAAGRLLPGFRRVGVRQLGPTGGRAVRVADGIAVRVALHGVEVHRDVRDTRLVGLGHRVARVEFVAGGVVGDGADDPAVLRAGVGLHAPVDPALEPDDRQDGHVHGGTEHRRRRRLVVGLVGDPGGLVPGVERLQHQELAQRVDLGDGVVPGGVGRDTGDALVHRGVVAFLHRHRELRHARLPRVALAVSVGVDEDRAFDGRVPADEPFLPDVDHAAVVDRDVEAVEDHFLRVVPQRQLVIAVGDVLDVELPVTARASHVGHLVVVAQRGQRDERPVDRTADAGPGDTGVGHAHSPGAADVGVDLHRDALDLPGRPGGQRLGPDEPEVDRGHRLGADGLFGVEPGVAFLRPDVPVVRAFQGRGLGPVGADRRDDGGGVAVRSHVGDEDVALRVADALAGRGRIDLRLAAGEDDLAGAVVDVLGAQRVSVVVGGNLTEHIGQVRGEPREAGLGTDLVGRVDRHGVVEHADPDVAQRQRVRLHGDGHPLGAAVHGEVRAVDLVAVGGEGNQVLPGWQGVERLGVVEVVLVALRDDRHAARRVADGRPLALRGEVRGTPGAGGEAVLQAVTGIPDVFGGDQPLVPGDRVPFADLPRCGSHGARAFRVQGDRTRLRGTGLRGAVLQHHRQRERDSGEHGHDDGRGAEGRTSHGQPPVGRCG